MDDKDFWLGYMMGSSEGESGGSGDGSGLLVILGFIGGFVLEIIFFTMFDVDVSDVPVLILLVGWLIGTYVAIYILSLIFGR